MTRTILVTGATGRQGGAVARQLLADNVSVRALTRNPDGAAARSLAAAGATIMAGDFDDPESLARALTGASGVFAMQTPYEAGTGQEEIHGVRLADAARQAGVEQFVYSSVAAADRPTGVAHFENKGRIEIHVRSLGFRRLTILRPTFFMEMLLSPGNLRALAQGRIALTLDPGTRVAMIAVDDIARMAAAAFRDPDGFNGKAIELAGDNPNFDEVAAAFGAALSRPVAYVQVAPEAIDQDTRPKLGTQRWLESEGWPIDLPTLRSSLPFEARTIRDWALENAAALAGAGG
jgi:uncharacterized protein YbjT (DUF2867 family)